MEPVVAAALITTHATSHRTPARLTQAARVEKVKRPSISSAGTTKDWQYFKSRWSNYVRATRLEGTNRVIQLLECCDDQLRKDLTRNAGGTLIGMTEDEVFTAMGRLAVREENTMVARVTLHNTRHDRDEPIRAYGARLRGQASICKFAQQCTGCDANVDYTESILKDVLCRGLEDAEIQIDLLGDNNQDMTWEQVLKFVEAKEAGKHITPSHLFTRQDRSLTERRKPSLMRGTVTTVYPFILRTNTTPLLSLLGADTDTAQSLKVTLPQGTDTPGDTTRSPHPSQTKPNVFFQACNWLDICGRHGITFNPEKFRFAQDDIEFAGFEITNDTVRPCKKYNRAISDFPTPQNLTDVRSWFGLVNQVSYAFSMTDVMLPFRELLKPSNKFHWDDTLQQAFQKSKLTIIDEIHNGVKIFDKTKPTCLATDWSKHGIDYWLFQKHCSCPSNDLFCCKHGWKITLVGSRFTHAAESRYAPIEGEALAVVDALDKARHFVLGCNNLTIAVDHRPLLKIFGDRSLDHICNTRLRNLKKKTLRYHFKMVHIPGVKNRAPDALSRHPTGDHHPPKMVLHDDIHSIQDGTTIPPLRIPTQLIAGICTDDQLCSLQTDNQLQESLTSSLHSTHTVNWEQVQTATSSDDNMLLLLSTIEDGIPEFKH